jgi:hypothetical protein
VVGVRFVRLPCSVMFVCHFHSSPSPLLFESLI